MVFSSTSIIILQVKGTSVNKQCFVIGAGIGGLSAAIHLALQGRQVRIFEQQPQVGGKLNQLSMQGFQFDTGPSLITMPYIFRDLFTAASRRLEDYLDLVPLDPTCRYVYRDGVVLNAWWDHQRLRNEFARLNPEDGEGFAAFLEQAGRIYRAAADPFLYNSLGSPLDVMATFARYIAQGHPGSQIPSDLKGEPADLVERWQAVMAALSPQTLDRSLQTFFHDPHLRQLFDRYATYNGSSPYQVGAVYSIIPYVELASGGWYLRGGIYTLAQAYARLAHELGVEIETNCAVARILVEHGEARGVVLEDGRVLRSDLVIANSDVVTTHAELLSPAVIPSRNLHRLERLEPSCSGFVILLGVDRKYPQLEHHNIFFSDDYRAEFEDLFEHHQPQRNPTIYICMSSKCDPTQAPEGCENLFILVNAPYLTDQVDWEQEAPRYRDWIIRQLVEHPQAGLKDLESHIVCEALLTPKDFYQKYGSNRGSIYGLSSNQRMAPFVRPGNRSSIVRNLYFVGGSTHPGGGVPLVTLSGKIVANLIARDQPM